MVSYGHCTQKICLDFAKRFGLTEKQMRGISVPFGCGMGHADTCGCVTGALIILGLLYAPDSHDDAERMAALLQEKTSEFESIFINKYGGLTCRDILKTDIAATPTAMKEAADAGLFAKICFPMIDDTCAMLEKFFSEHA
jgi:C_GCAxxG_C_C family probable redox protein